MSMIKWSKWLEPGEEILWSQLVEGHQQASTSENHEAARLMFEVASKGLNFISLFFFIKAAIERGDGNYLWIGLLLVAMAFGLSWFGHTRYGKRLKAVTERNVFSNGLITDRRAVFFNHYNGKKEQYSYEDIEGAVVDFENGGRALRIIPSVRRKRAVLVGTADFQKAVNIINSRLI